MATRMPWCFSLVMLFSDALGSVFSEASRGVRGGGAVMMLFSDALGSVFSEASRGVCSGGAAGLCEQLTFVSFSVTFFFFLQ